MRMRGWRDNGVGAGGGARRVQKVGDAEFCHDAEELGSLKRLRPITTVGLRCCQRPYSSSS